MQFQVVCCDLLSFYYLCRTRNNIAWPRSRWPLVVICFHFTIFVVLETTNVPRRSTSGRCDLLSFYYLCRTRNNKGRSAKLFAPVVICFHFTIFVVLETTRASIFPRTLCCDLLSFYYLCRTRNNIGTNIATRLYVVICFHFTIFVVLETTQLDKGCARISCDLLSFYYLCRTRNNTVAALSAAILVVICFHFTIFVVLETTHSSAGLAARCCDLLSFYYLCRTRNNEGCLISQLPTVVICFHFTIFVVLETTSNMRKLCRCCCDLLSFYYLCRTRNNFTYAIV